MAAHVAPRALDVAGLRHDVEVGLAVQQHAQAAAHHGVVVGEHDPDAFLLGGRRFFAVEPARAMAAPSLLLSHHRVDIHPARGALTREFPASELWIYAFRARRIARGQGVNRCWRLKP